MGKTKTKTPKVKFTCFTEGVAEKYPIIPTGKNHLKWMKRALEYYKSVPTGGVKITKCPGIASIVNEGWVMRSSMDIQIKTNGDGKNFWWATSEDQIKTEAGASFLGHYIHFHDPEQLMQFQEKTPNTLETVIKIQTPWFVEVPKGYSLLLMPLPYSDDKRFTAAMGLLRGNQPLNVQVFWHCLNSEEIIPAGTPLNQMILIKDQSVGYEINYEPNSAKFITEKFDKLFISPLDFHKEK